MNSNLLLGNPGSYAWKSPTSLFIVLPMPAVPLLLPLLKFYMIISHHAFQLFDPV